MIKPKKALGQNFLVDKKVVQNLSDAVAEGDYVLEIGAGTGTVTRELAKRALRVTAVEIDPDLLTTLQPLATELDHLEIINQDILKLDLREIFPGTSKFKIVGSIPYQITSPLLHRLLKNDRWTTVTLLIQKEVAAKICARPPHATYLSNFVGGLAEVKLVRNVPKTAFRPQPKVDGAIIKITRAQKPPLVDPSTWEDFLHRGFAHPRKMLRRIFPTEELTRAGISPTARAQVLTINDWQRLLAPTLAAGRSAKLASP